MPRRGRRRERRVCKSWARVPAGIANARARSLAAPIANRELQKSTGGGRKCSQLFPVEHEGGRGAGNPAAGLAKATAQSERDYFNKCEANRGSMEDDVTRHAK